MVLFYETRYIYEEANRIEPSPSVRAPCFNGLDQLLLKLKIYTKFAIWEEVNCIEPSSSLRVPWFTGLDELLLLLKNCVCLFIKTSYFN